MALGYVTKTKDYWIASNAVNITLNALGDANRIQGSVASGTVISCYIETIQPGGDNGDGLQLDNGRNPRRWPLLLSPTYFNSETEKYVYAAIPRSTSVGTQAIIVFPSTQLDIYGKNVNEEQIGSADYFYVYLNGIISEVYIDTDDNKQKRRWTLDPSRDWGSLGTYQDIIDMSKTGEWFEYSQTDQIVTFLKEIVMGAESRFQNLKALVAEITQALTLNGHSLTSVADENTPIDSDTAVATPDYVRSHYLSKRTDDTAAGFINFLKGLYIGDSFMSGLLGEGGVFRKDADGKIYLETDKLYVRMKAYFDSIEIRDFKHSGGNRIASKAGIKCARVEWLDVDGKVLEQTADNLSSVERFRCYFRASDGTDRVPNDFVSASNGSADLAFCDKTTLEQGINKRRYWRAVVGRNGMLTDADEFGWIDLSATDCEAGSDIPMSEDDIIQLGNRTDTERQGAIIEYVGGEDAPSYQIYQGIDSYDLTDKCYINIGYDSQTGRASMDVHGDFFFGDKDGSTYVRYNQATKKLEIKADVKILGGSNDGSDLSDVIDGIQDDVGGVEGSVSALSDTVSGINDNVSGLQTDISNMGKTIDGIGTQQGNLLRNTSFTGDYQSERVSDTEDVNGSNIIFSDPLKHWTPGGTVEQFDTLASASGYAIRVSPGGSVTQILEAALKKDAKYIVSFRAKAVNGSGKVAVQLGAEGLTANNVNTSVSITDTLTRYDVKFSPSTTTVKRFCLAVTSATVEIMEVQLMEGTIPTAWQPSFMDDNRAMGDYYAMKYLRDAIINGNTDIIGGLVLSQIFKVGLWRNGSFTRETGGLSGVYNDGNSPLLWGGGDMAQAALTIAAYATNPAYQPSDSELTNMAKVVITHGGRAILNDVILRGYVYARGGEFSGTVHSRLVYSDIKIIDDATVITPDTEPYSFYWIILSRGDVCRITLPDPTLYEGLEMSFLQPPHGVTRLSLGGTAILVVHDPSDGGPKIMSVAGERSVLAKSTYQWVTLETIEGTEYEIPEGYVITVKAIDGNWEVISHVREKMGGLCVSKSMSYDDSTIPVTLNSNEFPKKNIFQFLVNSDHDIILPSESEVAQAFGWPNGLPSDFVYRFTITVNHASQGHLTIKDIGGTSGTKADYTLSRGQSAEFLCSMFNGFYYQMISYCN